MSKEKIDLRPVLWKVGVAVTLSFAGLNFARFRDRKKNKPSSPTPPHSSGPSQEMITDVSETSIREWDVFLSFRGPDTRYKFTDNLYNNLIKKNIRVFRDVEGIRAGDKISQSLDEAIERSRLSVVIFSKDYASSDSCLDELVTILECKKKRQQRVIPIFYEVKVSELKCHKMDVQKYGEDKLQKWTLALEEASELKGESYRAGSYEHEFLEKIVNQIMSFLGPNKVLLGELVKISNKVLDDAENKEITDPDVKSWLDELKDEVYDAEDLLAYDSHAIASDSSSVVAKVGTKVEEKLKEIHERLAQRKKEMEKLGLGDCGREADVYGHNLPLKRITTSLVDESEVEGRETDTEAITKLLMSEETNGANGLGVIAIVGIGGLGKTTLARLVYRQKEVSEKFHLKAWICVSEEKDVFVVTKNILKGFAHGVPNIVIPNIDSMTEDLLHTSLRDALTGKRFLLVLDDVWNESYDNFWKDLLKPLKHGLQGSRIIVTTRSHNVTKSVGISTVRAYDLKGLTDDECWSVIARRAFIFIVDEPTDYSDLVTIGRQLATKCKGLPLAANALGSLLSENQDAKEWQGILESEIWNLRDIGHRHIRPVLWLSYCYLLSSHKRCFAYCALFPKDYEFKKHELVRLWMAEGILASDKGKKTMEETAVNCFDALLSRSFFQKARETPECFVMHDLIHDLAKHVAGDFFYLKERDNASPMPEKTRHFSYHLAQSETSQNCAVIYQSKSLRTFLCIRSSRWHMGFEYEDTAVVHHLLETSKYLRVLSLAYHYNMKEVPESIGNLKLLRYLDLSWTSIKRLPDVVFKLCYLETLLLEGCRELKEVPDSIIDLKLLHFLNLSRTTINKLPTDLCKLVNLCFLDISNTELQGMPPELGKLIRLQKLEDFFVGKGSSWSSIEELKELSKLEGMLRIWNVQNIMNAQGASGSNLKGTKQLRVLELSWEGDEADDLQHELRVLEGLEPPCTLEHLTMRGYRSTKFPDWVGYRSFSKLVSLRIEGCKNCCEMPTLGHVGSLTRLYISGCDSIIDVGPSFYGSPPSANDEPAFKSLKVLHFEGMSEWETWAQYDGAFPSLEELRLSECPKLRSALPSALPSLKKLKIEGCKNYYEMPPLGHVDSLTSLYISGCDGIVDVGPSFYGSPLPAKDEPTFKSLKVLHFEGMSEWITWAQHDGAFPSLEELRLSKCPKLESALPGELPSLKELKIKGCDQLVAPFPRARAIVKVTVKDKSRDVNLDLDSDGLSLFLSGIKTSSPYQLLGDIRRPLGERIVDLKRLSIFECDFAAGDQGTDSCSQLGGFLEHFKWLNTLEIDSSPEVVCFPMCELATLTRLELKYLEKLKSLPEQMKSGLPCLVDLMLWYCPELESFPEGGLPSKLELLIIYGCKKLMERPKEWNLQALPSLSYLNYKNYSFDETESFPGEGMLLPPTLTTLHIGELDGLKSLDYKGLQHLTSLKTLAIWYCYSLEKLVTEEEGGEEGPLLQSLTTLVLCGLYNLKSLSPIHRLTSLRSLIILGCYEISEEVALPSTITCLNLEYMKMKSLDGWGLQRLTSLEELRILLCDNIESITTREEPLPSSLRVMELKSCPRLRSIQRGDAFPSSLQSLHIVSCPLLEEKYQRELIRYV